MNLYPPSVAQTVSTSLAEYYSIRAQECQDHLDKNRLLFNMSEIELIERTIYTYEREARACRIMDQMVAEASRNVERRNGRQ